jgi:hypothetical protein
MASKPGAETRTSLYDRDFYTWVLSQARALRQRSLKELEADHLAEELEDMGRSELRELESRLIALLAHLLKWAYQPDARSKSWRLTIKEQRLAAGKLMGNSPSLKSKLPEVLRDAYERARLAAARETPLEESDFPAECPWAFEQLMDHDFWPPAPAGNGKARARRSRLHR